MLVLFDLSSKSDGQAVFTLKQGGKQDTSAAAASIFQSKLDFPPAPNSKYLTDYFAPFHRQQLAKIEIILLYPIQVDNYVLLEQFILASEIINTLIMMRFTRTLMTNDHTV